MVQFLLGKNILESYKYNYRMLRGQCLAVLQNIFSKGLCVNVTNKFGFEVRNLESSCIRRHEAVVAKC